MNTPSSRVSKVITFTAALVGLLLAAAPGVFASPADHVDEGLAVSKEWVGLIDTGQYDASYSEASGAMHEKVPQDRWNIILKALRAPWGEVVSRQQLSHVYKPDGFEGTEGEFLVVTYNSTFKKQDGVMELVVLRWEDGQWRGAGYNAGQKPDPAAATTDAAPNSSTEVQTENHVKPIPQ